jgi:hypothetical protein
MVRPLKELFPPGTRKEDVYEVYHTFGLNVEEELAAILIEEINKEWNKQNDR